MKNKQWIAVLALITVIASGCSAAGGEETNGQGAAVQQPAGEAPTGDASEKPDETATDGPAEEPDAGQPAPELAVVTGEEKEIETMIEGMSEKVLVTDFTLSPYSIQYHLRSRFGEPTLENGQAVHQTQMGENAATIAITVLDGVSLEEAVAELKTQYADGYEASSESDISTDVNTFPGKQQGFRKDGMVYGYHVFDVGGNALVITRSYPEEAGDGMAAMLRELTESITIVK